MRIAVAALLAALLTLTTGCSPFGDTETFPAEPGFEIDDLPEVRPADFTASYSTNGGMAPWSEHLKIESERAEYRVWMSDVTYIFSYSPTVDQLDDLYSEVRLGRFGEYLVVPFAEGEEVYDAGESRYAVTAAGFSHRIAYSTEELKVPDTENSPLTALREFVDADVTPEAAARLTIRYDDAISDLNLEDLRVHVELADSTFAIGEERWANEFEIGWSGGAGSVDVVVTVTTGPFGEEPTTLAVGSLRLESGTVLHLERTADDDIEVRAP